MGSLQGMLLNAHHVAHYFFLSGNLGITPNVHAFTVLLVSHANAHPRQMLEQKGTGNAASGVTQLIKWQGQKWDYVPQIFGVLPILPMDKARSGLRFHYTEHVRTAGKGR